MNTEQMAGEVGVKKKLLNTKRNQRNDGGSPERRAFKNDFLYDDMEYFNNTLAVPASWLIDEGIMSEDNYRNLTNRNRINVVRRGCRNTPALVAYDSMPERFKSEISKRIGGDPYKQAQINQLEIRIEPNIIASDFFDNYKLTDGRNLPKETRREYYANAIVLDAIHTLINDKRSKHSALGHKTSRAWEQISEAVQELDRSKYPHALPANFRRLEERYKKYMKEGVESLIHKNFTNKNAAKVDDDVKEAVLAELLADPRNLDNAQVARFYNTMSGAAGWKSITAATVANWRDEFDTNIYAGRRGSVAFSNKKGMQVKRSAPSCPLYFWTMDGWDVELLFQKTETNKNTGYSNTTYHHRVTVVVVLDAMNKYPVGYAIGLHESPDLIKMALRNAAKHTQELFGKMYRTHQVQSDRYQIKNLTPFYEIIADKSTPARAKNSKAKIIEPYFNHLNKDYCQLQTNWAGFGITSKKESQPNNEYLNKYKKDFPDYDGVCAQVVDIIEKERAAKLEQYLQKWSEMPEADKVEFKTENYLLAFGETLKHSRTDKETTVMMQDNGIKVTINGIKHEYDCFDLALRDHYSTQWKIKYDPSDVSKVLAVNADETLRFILDEKYVQPMALKDRKPGDSGELQKVREFNASLDKQAIDFRAQNIEKMASVMPLMLQNDTLGKLMLTDSHGQHKDRRNDSRRDKSQEPRTKIQNRAVDVEVEDEETDFRLNKY
jgi:hypothetical protein